MRTKIVLFSVFLFCLINQTEAQSNSFLSPVYSKIAFSRQESQNDWDLWIMDINGSNQTRINNSTSNDADPHFKFDGNKIVFSRFTQGTPPTQDIYTIDPDGNNLTNLTSDIQSEAARPKWSWDGTKIVYCITAGIDNKDIYTMNSDGTGKTALITGSNNDEWPSFSPDGLYLIFQRYVGAISNQKTKICRYRILDGTITELTDGSNLDEMPVYSPDGSYILFKRGTTNPDIYRLRLDNMTTENLTNNSVADDAPAYSYDGTRIAWFQSTSGMSTAEIWIMNSDGSGKTQLTSNSVADFNPTFSPFTQTTGPEININGNSVDISSGDTTPASADHTDFGNVLVDGGSVSRTFTIENKGTQNLTLSGNPVVQLSGTNASDFSLVANPSTTIAAGGSTTFQIRFDPESIGTKTSTVSIPNNDTDENPYTFAIQGKGTVPGQAVYNKIALTRSESQTDWDIWLIDRDGSNEQRLVNNSYRDTNPHFNPQGTKIVFARITSQQPMQSDIYVMDSDGSNETNLTDIAALTQPCVGPHFSWDGSKIAFDVTASVGNGDLWTMNSDGTGHTAVLATSGDDSSPAFSPDGQWLVFQRQVAENPNPKAKICKVKISDGTVVDLTDGSNLDETPVYSTDGQYILFKRGYTEWDLYRMPHDHNPSNTNDIINITNQPTMPAGTANYSWEGDKIVYYTGQLAPETSEIYIMNTDGTGNTKITNNSVADWDPSFSPAQSASAPEINIKGNEADILNGDITPSSSDHTDFGSAPVDGGSVTRTFKIENKGTENLLLTGNPLVQLAGTNAADFSVTLLPSSTISAGGSTTFQIKFDPSDSGNKTAIISIPNNDSDENPYSFTIQGNGTATPNSVYNKIAFCRQESSSDWDIWVMDSDGSNQVKILESDSKDMNPHFSPDGKYIAFSRTSGSSPNITNDVYIMNSDGTNATNLTSDISESCVGPKFAWDGNKLAFFRNYTGSGFVLCTMNLDGTNKQYINDQAGSPVVGDSPFFTPDGQWVVFQRVNPDQLTGAIYKVPVAGGTVIQLTNASDFDELPRVSPDGQYVICKYAPVAGGKSDIAKFSINQTPQTSSVSNLTSTVNEDEDSPMYSYEGDKIAYMGTAGGSMEIFVMNSDGSNKTRLTNNSVQDFDPTFSPALVTAPEINLKGNSQNIVNGDSSPSTEDHSDFGNALIDNGTATRTFTIENTGTADLILSGNPLVQISGTNASEFIITSNPVSTISAGTSSAFQIRFDPAAVGLRSAIISIPNNDSDENPYTFSIQGTGTVSAPIPPTLLTPANGTINVALNITLTWNSSPNTESYQLQVSTDPNFTTTVLNQSGITAISYNITGLLNNTTYYWRVNAINTGGTSSWSATWNFTTIVALPEKVTLISPDNNEVLSTLNVNLQWNTSDPQVDIYWLEIADNINMTNPTVDQNISATQKSFQAEVNKSYWWKVKAHNIAGWGEFSSTFKFTIGIPPAQITLLTPSNGEINCATVQNLSWTPVANILSYQLQLSTTENFSNPLIDDASITSASKNVTSLLNNQVYYWRVRGINQFGNGPWSAAFNFTTIVAFPEKVTLHAPENNSSVNSNDVVLSWNATSPQVDKYWLEIADNINMNNPVVNQNIETTQKSFQAEANKSYWWKVKAHNIAGWGEFSDIWKFNSMTVDVKDETIPTTTELFQNYPNPFNPSTVINYQLPEEGFATLKIFDLLGREIIILVNEYKTPGKYSVEFLTDGLPISSGIYIYTLSIGEWNLSRKMILLK